MSKKSPQLRFEGFTDAWEERKFFESIASTIDFRGRTPKKLGMDWSDSGYLALSALNVKNGYIDPLADAHYGDEKLYRKWMSGRELKKGQVLFTTEAPMGNVAQVPDDNGYILSQRTVAFETKEDMMTNDFLAVLLKSPLVFNNLTALSSGGTAKGVSQKSLKGLSITVPLDIDEQQKIGSFFKQLDNTITLHQRKLDLLKEQKKGYLQKMFPKNGAKVPELRFAGFADDWEERKLGDITKISTGKLDANAMVENGKYDFYTSGIKKYRIDVAAFEGPSITIAGNGATVGYMHLADNKFNAYQRTYVLQEFLVDRSFIFSEIGNKLPKKIKQEARTGNIPYIVMDMLTELKLSIPQNNSEQQKIGSFFKQLDDTIDLHQRKLDLLKEQKKSFLQKMFV